MVKEVLKEQNESSTDKATPEQIAKLEELVVLSKKAFDDIRTVPYYGAIGSGVEYGDVGQNKSQRYIFLEDLYRMTKERLELVKGGELGKLKDQVKLSNSRAFSRVTKNITKFFGEMSVVTQALGGMFSTLKGAVTKEGKYSLVTQLLLEAEEESTLIKTQNLMEDPGSTAEEIADSIEDALMLIDDYDDLIAVARSTGRTTEEKEAAEASFRAAFSEKKFEKTVKFFEKVISRTRKADDLGKMIKLIRNTWTQVTGEVGSTYRPLGSIGDSVFGKVIRLMRDHQIAYEKAAKEATEALAKAEFQNAETISMIYSDMLTIIRSPVLKNIYLKDLETIVQDVRAQYDNEMTAFEGLGFGAMVGRQDY